MRWRCCSTKAARWTWGPGRRKPRCMTRRNGRRGARQLELREQPQQSPVWAELPEERRREVVELLVQLLRSAAGVAEENGDE